MDPLEVAAKALEKAPDADDEAARLGLAICARDVADAARRIAPHAKRTPVVTSQTLDARVFDGIAASSESRARTVFCKCENFQKVGAFKFRGACNAVFAQPAENLPTAGFITHSSGNHGQALALAGKLRKMPVTIVVPEGAPKAKVDAMRGYGAKIVEVDSALRAAKTQEIADATGALLVHPSNEPLVMAGQGTVFAELWAQLNADFGGAGDDLDVIVVPVGGGGVISGVAVAARALLGRTVKIIAAEPELADDAARSRAASTLQGHRDGKVPQTIADGLRTTLGDNTWPVVRDLVDDVVLVSEAEITQAMYFAFERLKLVIEPSAAVSLAAVLSPRFKLKILDERISRIGVVLTGGNLSLREILPFQRVE